MSDVPAPPPSDPDAAAAAAPAPASRPPRVPLSKKHPYIDATSLAEALNARAAPVLQGGDAIAPSESWSNMDLQFVPLWLPPWAYPQDMSASFLASTGACVFVHYGGRGDKTKLWGSAQGRLLVFYHTVLYEQDHRAVVFYHVHGFGQRPTEPAGNRNWCMPRYTDGDHGRTSDTVVEYFLKHVFQVKPKQVVAKETAALAAATVPVDASGAGTADVSADAAAEADDDIADDVAAVDGAESEEDKPHQCENCQACINRKCHKKCRLRDEAKHSIADDVAAQELDPERMPGPTDDASAPPPSDPSSPSQHAAVVPVTALPRVAPAATKPPRRQFWEGSPFHETVVGRSFDPSDAERFIGNRYKRKPRGGGNGPDAGAGTDSSASTSNKRPNPTPLAPPAGAADIGDATTPAAKPATKRKAKKTKAASAAQESAAINGDAPTADSTVPKPKRPNFTTWTNPSLAAKADTADTADTAAAAVVSTSAGADGDATAATSPRNASRVRAAKLELKTEQINKADE